MRTTLDHFRGLLAGAVRLRPHLRGGRYLIGAVLVTAVLSAGLEGVGVGLLVPLLSLLLGGDSPTPMRPLVWLAGVLPGSGAGLQVAALCAVIVGAIGAKNATLYLSQALAARLKRRIGVNLRCALFERLLDADLAVYEERPAGEMANVFLTETHRTFLSIDYLLLFLQRASMAGFYFVGLVFISWQLSALTVLLGIAVGWAIGGCYRRLARTGEQLSECNRNLGTRLMQVFSGIRVIRATHTRETERLRMLRVVEEQAAAEERGARLGQALFPLTETVAVLGAMGIVAVAYIFLVRPGLLLPSYLLGFGFILLRLLPLLNQLYVTQGNLINLAASVREIERWMAVPSHPARPFGDRAWPATEGDIRFEGVEYTYPNGTVALRGVSFTIPKGSTVALVGPSGSGKSTIASLALRFRAPTRGAIRVAGMDHWECSSAEWYRNVAAVEQDAFVFHETLRWNIAFGAEGGAGEAMTRAVRLAHLGEVVAALPQGLDTVVGERGAFLSGGQRQRLAIARALFRDPRWLILDEATSALDPISEREVQLALREAARGRTVLVIAHRLSTIREADWVVVLDGGEVRQQGTWDQLLEQGGLFSELVSVYQSRGGPPRAGGTD